MAVQALEDGNILVTVEDNLGKRNITLALVPAFRFALSLLRACEERTEKLVEQLKAETL